MDHRFAEFVEPRGATTIAVSNADSEVVIINCAAAKKVPQLHQMGMDRSISYLKNLNILVEFLLRKESKRTMTVPLKVSTLLPGPA